ncbi:zinc-ribbon domain-containing protein [Candidatus Pelagibacter bacterium nBUS_36]|uniref:zinc-ribbon domain-containing protein n=1 Tax=Candidatus Pelagibacter bacterium nBUS_36 TaxID=3374194 RepID=UPI003EBD6AC7
MIIQCLNCNKKFNVVDELIPDGGRLIQCGSCDHSWHYKNENISLETLTTDNDNNQKIPVLGDIKKDNDNRNVADDDAPAIKKQETNTELTKVKKNIKIDNTKVEKNRVVNFFSYLLVFIISFVALIILLDTLKSPLINFFPELEVVLFNLFESLKDVKLFIIDLT